MKLRKLVTKYWVHASVNSSNSVKALIQFMEGHQGPLKLHVHLGEREKTEFSLKQKNNMCGDFVEPFKSSLSLVGA